MKISRFRNGLICLFTSSVILIGNFSIAGESFKNGKEILAANSEIANSENGFFVKVPVDYKDSTKGITEIYAHFRNPFNPNLPTYVLFTGGPGQSSHFPSGGKADLYANIGYNFLLFDQRGIAFSRPETEEMWKNPEFHSSENNAKDLEEIRKFLKLDKLSIYGASYGTVPATIYGNLFPNSTRSVVLEGVVYDGFDLTPQLDDFLPKVIQKYFNSLAPKVQEKLNKISNDIILPKMWFPAYTQAYLAFSGTQSLPQLTSMLVQATSVEDEKFLEEFKKAQAVLQNGQVPPKSLDEDMVNALLLAKEFGMARTDISTQLILEGGKIKRQVTGSASMYVTEATRLGIPLEKKSTYRALDYPLEVPTYYINGSRDGATIPPWLIKHWKNVPKGEAYLLILKEGGHMPGGQILRFGLTAAGDANAQAKDFFNGIFKKMLNAEAITKDQIENWNKIGISKLAFTAKHAKNLKCDKLF